MYLTRKRAFGPRGTDQMLNSGKVGESLNSGKRRPGIASRGLIWLSLRISERLLTRRPMSIRMRPDCCSNFNSHPCSSCGGVGRPAALVRALARRHAFGRQSFEGTKRGRDGAIAFCFDDASLGTPCQCRCDAVGSRLHSSRHIGFRRLARLLAAVGVGAFVAWQLGLAGAEGCGWIADNRAPILVWRFDRCRRCKECGWQFLRLR